MNKSISIIVIGGGIIGCSIAYELSKNGYTNITVLEKNTSIPGLNQSSTNEGSIHSGIYYPQDIMPLKAKLCVEGNRLLYEFLEEHELPYKKVGKLIIATTIKEEAYLDFFLQIGGENGIPGIKKLTGIEARRMEPNIANVIAALYVPSTGCTSPNGLIKKIKNMAEERKVLFKLGIKVVGIIPRGSSLTLAVETNRGMTSFKSDMVINAAGLYSDEVARLVNPAFPYEIDPARGEFFQYDKSTRKDIGMNGMHVYQPPYCYTTENGKMKMVNVPPKDLRKRLKEGNVIITAGVHLSPSYDEVNGLYVLGNTVTISPLKTTGLGKVDYTSDLHVAEHYIQKIHYFFPNLKVEDIKADHTGIMSPLKNYRDFIIEPDKKYSNFINLVGMESPAWTSCLAVAKYVAIMIN